MRVPTAEQRPVEGERLWEVLDVCDALVHGPGEVVGVVEAAEDDAGEVDGLGEVAHQRTLDSHHVPSAREKHSRHASKRNYTLPSPPITAQELSRYQQVEEV